MSVILVLIVFSVLLAVGFLIAFFWSVRSGQYDDTYGSSVRILFDDDKPSEMPVESQTDASPSEEPSTNH